MRGRLLVSDLGNPQNLGNTTVVPVAVAHSNRHFNSCLVEAGFLREYLCTVNRVVLLELLFKDIGTSLH